MFFDSQNYYDTKDSPSQKWWYRKSIIESALFQNGRVTHTVTQEPSDKELAVSFDRLAMPLARQLDRLAMPLAHQRVETETPSEFYIALRKLEEIEAGILSGEYFKSNGYIPVVGSPVDAVLALFDADHEARISAPPDFKVFRIHNDGCSHRNYIKHDRKRPGHFRLFFEVGLPGKTRHPSGWTETNGKWEKLCHTWQAEEVSACTLLSTQERVLSHVSSHS